MLTFECGGSVIVSGGQGRAAGAHVLVGDGRRSDQRAGPAGVYLIRLNAGGRTAPGTCVVAAW